MSTTMPLKKARVIDLLQRQHGATITELMAATGWRERTVRAFLHNLKKYGVHTVRTGPKRYQIK